MLQTQRVYEEVEVQRSEVISGCRRRGSCPDLVSPERCGITVTQIDSAVRLNVPELLQ